MIALVSDAPGQWRPTHGELVGMAAQWLHKRCRVVVTELTTGIGEEPDAIGWGTRGESTLVECKASRSDFLRDRAKGFRRSAGRGVGSLRYFLCPPELIDRAELPPCWGLLYARPDGRARMVVKAKRQPAFVGGEVQMLLSAIQRLACEPIRPVSVKFYTMPSTCTATLGVRPMAGALSANSMPVEGAATASN